MSDIMEIIDEREKQKNKDKNKRVTQATVKVWELNGFTVRLI